MELDSEEESVEESVLLLEADLVDFLEETETQIPDTQGIVGDFLVAVDHLTTDITEVDILAQDTTQADIIPVTTGEVVVLVGSVWV